MIRIRAQRFAEPINAALGVIPPRALELIGPFGILAGVDPIYAGVFGPYENEAHPIGASYRSCAHTVYPWNITRPANDRCHAIVLPLAAPPTTVVHEIAHLLHAAIGFETLRPVEVSPYAETNDLEAFAEAFTALHCPGDWLESDGYVWWPERVHELREVGMDW